MKKNCGWVNLYVENAAADFDAIKSACTKVFEKDYGYVDKVSIQWNIDCLVLASIEDIF